MNALIKKEVRLLLPAFCAASALACTNLLLPRNPEGLGTLWCIFPFVSCPAIALMMALGSFGAEVGSGTLPLLLAQPVARQKTWNIKIGLLAIAFVSVGVIWCGAFGLRVAIYGSRCSWADLLWIVSLSGLVIFSGGLWTVLLLRQLAAAFWFTLVTPGLVVALLLAVSRNQSAALVTRLLEGGLLLYGVGGILFARWLYLRAQDLEGTGGNIALPQLKGFSLFAFASGVRRQWRPRAALRGKEIGLHESALVVAGILALLHLGIVSWRWVGGSQRNFTMEFIGENFWMLWLVMPLLVGCTAAVEERRLGTLQAQLCLPVRRRTQFAVKLGCVLFLSVLLGVILPALLELGRVLPAIQEMFAGQRPGPVAGAIASHGQIHAPVGVVGLVALGRFLAFPAIAAAVALVSFYASTLSRNVLQALGLAVLGLVFACFLSMTSDSDQWWRLLACVLGVPVLALVLVALSFRNWQDLQISRQAGLINLLMLLLAGVFIVAATSALAFAALKILNLAS